MLSLTSFYARQNSVVGPAFANSDLRKLPVNTPTTLPNLGKRFALLQQMRFALKKSSQTTFRNEEISSEPVSSQAFASETSVSPQSAGNLTTLL